VKPRRKLSDWLLELLLMGVNVSQVIAWIALFLMTLTVYAQWSQLRVLGPIWKALS
jgi:hypothetical protein